MGYIVTVRTVTMDPAPFGYIQRMQEFYITWSPFFSIGDHITLDERTWEVISIVQDVSEGTWAP